MPVAEVQGDRIVVATEYRDRELIKQVPGAKYDQDSRTWSTALSWAACIQLRGIFGADLQVGQALAAWAQSDMRDRIQPCLALRTAADCDDLAVLTALRPFQRAGVKFLATAKQALIADEMGLGKTVQAIAALEVLGESAYPALIVCPNSMKLTWAEEFSRWAPSRRVQVIHGGTVGKQKQIATLIHGQTDVGIINYESVRLHSRLASYGSVTLTDEEKSPKELNQVAWGTVIADEAHRAKDPHAKQTRALWYLGDAATYRFALTGTPVANSPEDIWTLMRFVSREEFPAKTKFIERYAMQSWNMFGSMEVVGLRPEAQAELFRIVDPRLIRRLKASVLPELPEKTYATRTVVLPSKQRRAYDQIRKEMLAELDTGVLVASNALTKATRLVQFASAYGEMGDPAFVVRLQGQVIAGPFSSRDLAEQARVGLAPESSVYDATPLTLTDPSCKVDALEEIAAELGDQQAVVFAESRQLIELAAARLVAAGYKIGQVTGAIAPHDRQINVNAFQEGKLKILLLTLSAGGEGLTLTAASTAIFLQRSWSAVHNLQAEDRIHRMGQESSSVTIVDIVAADTIEARVHAVRREKGDQMEEFVRDVATLKAWLAK